MSGQRKKSGRENEERGGKEKNERGESINAAGYRKQRDRKRWKHKRRRVDPTRENAFRDRDWGERGENM